MVHNLRFLQVARVTCLAGGPEVANAEESQAAAQPQAAAPPPPAPSGKKLPLGTVVSSLPGGCSEKPVGGVEYYHCGSNYYRAVFQGNNLVYVTAQP